ncbi:MAG TPA: hypothetical protein PKA00_03480 [Saprospiraceae bacterium]|nr:hypothetical protein [Saprospiraceae bacterium]HMQ81938.1 hypothetical protein [Saprospiraceae bacterium]
MRISLLVLMICFCWLEMGLKAQENTWQLQRTNVKASMTNRFDFILPVASLAFEHRLSEKYSLNLEIGLPVHSIWNEYPIFDKLSGFSIRTGHRFHIFRTIKQKSQSFFEVMGTYQHADAVIAGDFHLSTAAGDSYFQRLYYDATLHLYRGSMMVVLQQTIIDPVFIELGIGLKLTYRAYRFDFPDGAVFESNGSTLWSPLGFSERNEAFFPGYGLYLNLGCRL